MENLKSKIIGLLVIPLLLISCLEDADIGNAFIADESVNFRFAQSQEWNKTNEIRNLQTDVDHYVLFSFGDVHVGGTKNLNKVYEDFNQQQALGIVFVGDNTTGHEKDYDVLDSTMLKHQDIPQYLMVGNHDLFFHGWEHHYAKFGSSSYSFEVETPVAKDWFICLDSGSGTLGKDQLAWLKAELTNKRKNYRRCVVFSHNNLFRFRRTMSTTPPIDEIQTLLDLFTRHEVDMVITGHDHEYSYKTIGNTTHIIMDALQDISDNASYLKITIDKGLPEFETISVAD